MSTRIEVIVTYFDLSKKDEPVAESYRAEFESFRLLEGEPLQEAIQRTANGMLAQFDEDDE